MMVPKIEKIIVNMGVGRAVENSKAIDEAVTDLAKITGQMPVVTRARKSVSNFKLRVGMPIGCKVTLRGTRMYDFLDKLVRYIRQEDLICLDEDKIMIMFREIKDIENSKKIIEKKLKEVLKNNVEILKNIK